MAKPAIRERLEHVLEAIGLIRQFVDHMSEGAFLADRKVQSAVQYQFLIIGEAVKSTDNTILEKYDYPWHIPRTFRNFIIHEYHGVKMERIYRATQELEKLETQVKAILENES